MSRRAAILATLLYIAIWIGAFAVRTSLGGATALPLFSVGVFAVMLPPSAWWLTRNAQASLPTVVRPTAELLTILLYLALFAFVVLGWGVSALKVALPDARSHDLGLATVKVLTMIVMPVLILHTFGSRDLLAARFSAKMLPALLILGTIIVLISTFVTGASASIAALPPAALLWSIPACFVWLAVTAGFAEEVLFRVVLQTRLEAVFNTVLPAVAVASLIFALVHVPGLVLRGDSSDPSTSTLPGAIAYAITVLSPPGIFLGLVWMRTRSLALIVILHTLIDLPPNLADFAHEWVRAL